MNWIESLFLGLVQGFTEFLPISSSGHLALFSNILGVNSDDDMAFTVILHGGTMLSTLVVFFHEIWKLFKESLTFKWNESTSYVAKIILSMIPVVIVGLFLEDYIEQFFEGRIMFIGFMLLITATFLTFAHFYKGKEREINYKDSFIIGLAQAVAVIPGISRSGATISAGLLLGNRKDKIAQFSFLMVLLPILGANAKMLMDNNFVITTTISPLVMLVGFIVAFISGWIACKWMIKLVKKGKLLYFAIYCAIIGIITIVTA